MRRKRNSCMKIVLPLAVAAIVTTLASTAVDAGAFLSSKVVFTGSFGREVNTGAVESHLGPSLEDLCVVKNGDTCKIGKESHIGGGFAFPEGVAVGPAPGHLVYVADKNNGRVQVFSPAGVFISAFGLEVDKTTKGNVCTAESHDECGAGATAVGGPAGQIASPVSVSVDQTTGDVYVLDITLHRIEKYTATGELVWMIGGHVNTVGASEAETSICTVSSGDLCQAGVESAKGAFPHGAFKPEIQHGNLIIVGGPEDLVYLGDEGRVVEFSAVTGAWVREVSLTSLATEGHVRALDVANGGELYVAYSDLGGKGGGGIHVLSSTGTPLREIDAAGHVLVLALDPFGRLAVIDNQPAAHGLLYEASTGSLLSEFGAPEGVEGAHALAANRDPSGNGEFYSAMGFHHEVQMYEPVPVVEVITSPCKNQTGTSVTFAGEANPKEVAETKVWFQYGTTEALGSTSSVLELAKGHELVPVEATVTGLLPNQTYYDRFAGEDANYKPTGGQEPLAGTTLQCTTLYLPPVVEEETQSYEPTFSSVLVEGSLNPEHAKTTYWIEYGACEKLTACASKGRSAALESSEYGVIGVRRAVGGLQPSTTYHYALVAESESAKKTEHGRGESEEGEFTTLPAPHPVASTSPATSVGVSRATIAGTVDGDGAQAVYSFEVGINKGFGTVYSTVVAGGVSAEAGLVAESFGLTGLQASTTYAFRMKIASSYGTSVGEPGLFTTTGEPSVPAAPSLVQLLPLPPIEFPKPAQAKKAKPKKKSKTKKHGKAKAKKSKARKSPARRAKSRH